ncbi:MAG: HAD-IC family P-type ATPase, partial [Clostridia bacterium]|nr:HAD-IC family P-type ATPase [Clostridia bacterium]
MGMNNWFNQTDKEVEENLNTNMNNGLSLEEVHKRQEKYGLNELKQGKKKSLFVKFLEQFKDFMIIVLIIAAIVSGAVGIAQGEGITDTIIIMIVVIANAIIGVAQESKAEKSLEALQKLSGHEAKVLRNGAIQVVPAKDLVPGDIVVLETGDYIPADLRIFEAINFKVQESSLTGESVPVEKFASRIDEEEVPLGDRGNMLFSSSLVTYGRGRGIVVETGMNTEVGKIAGMLTETVEQETPLQKKLNGLGKTLGIAALAICIVIFLIGIIEGREVISMFMTAVSLAVAAIPEGLAAVSTIVLAIGVQKMVKKNAIVKKLPAVETLGSSTVICSDKTGTLTQNKMTVQKLFANSNTYDLSNDEEINIFKTKNIDIEEIQTVIYNGVLCNDTKVAQDGTLTGDPTETALVDIAIKLDVDINEVDNSLPRVDEIPFDSDRK